VYIFRSQTGELSMYRCTFSDHIEKNWVCTDVSFQITN